FYLNFGSTFSTNIGLAPGPGVARLTFGTAPPTIGGAAGTTGAAIIPFAAGTAAADGFLTYGSNGVRPLQSGEFVQGSLAANSNVLLSSNVANNGSQTVNSLFIFGGTGVTGTGTLT